MFNFSVDFFGSDSQDLFFSNSGVVIQCDASRSSKSKVVTKKIDFLKFIAAGVFFAFSGNASYASVNQPYSESFSSVQLSANSRSVAVNSKLIAEFSETSSDSGSLIFNKQNFELSRHLGDPKKLTSRVDRLEEVDFSEFLSRFSAASTHYSTDAVQDVSSLPSVIEAVKAVLASESLMFHVFPEDEDGIWIEAGNPSRSLSIFFHSPATDEGIAMFNGAGGDIERVVIASGNLMGFSDFLKKYKSLVV